MAERHDIVLGLKLSEFSRNIKTAQDDLAKLQQQVTNFAATVGKTIGQIKVNVDLSGLTPLNKTLDNLNATLNKFTGNLSKSISKASDSASKAAVKDIKAIQKATDEAAVSAKQFSKQLTLPGVDPKFLQSSAKQIKEVSESIAKIKPVGVQGELFTPSTLRNASRKPIQSAEEQANAFAKAESERVKTQEKASKEIVRLQAQEAREKLREQKRAAADERKIEAQRIRDARRDAREKALAAKEATKIQDAIIKGGATGLAHTAGNVIAGGNPLTALLHEVPRNIAISLTRVNLKPLVQQLTGVGQAAQGAQQQIAGLGQQVNTAATGGVRLTQAYAQTATTVGGLSSVFNSATLGAVAVNGAFLGVGIVLDKVGDSILRLAGRLAEASGEMSLATLQLNAVLADVSRTTGLNVGTIEEWNKALKQTQVESGQAVDDLTRISTVFLQLNDTTELSADQLQELVRVTAVLATPVFGGLSKALLSIKGGLSGNLRAIRDNVSVGENQAALTANYIEILKRQGKTQEEATRIANDATAAQRFFAVFMDRTKGQVDSLTKNTDKLVIAQQQLRGAFAFLQQQIGAGIEPAYAKLVTAVKNVVLATAQLNPELLKGIGTLIGVAGVVSEVAGKMLKWLGIIGLITIAIKALNASLSLTIPLLGGSIAGSLTLLTAKMTGTIPVITTLSSAFKALGSIAITMAKGAGITTVFAAAMAGLGAVVLSTTKFFGAFLLALAKNPFTYVLLAIPLVISAFRTLDKELIGISAAFKALNDVARISFGPLGSAVSSLVDQLGIGTRTIHAMNAIVMVIVVTLQGLITVILGLANSIVILNRLWLSSMELVARFTNDAKRIEILKRKQEELNKTTDDLREAYKKLAAAGQLNNARLKDEINLTLDLEEARKRAALAADDLQQKEQSITFGERAARFTDDQLKAFERMKGALQDQVNAARIRNVELESGKAAAAQEKFNITVREGFKEIEASGKLTEKFKAEKIAELSQLEATSRLLERRNEHLEEQRRLMQSILGTIVNQGKAFRKQLDDIHENRLAEDQYGSVLLKRTGYHKDIVRQAEEEREIKKTTLDIDNKIKEIENQIVSRGRVGTDVDVTLDSENRTKALKELEDLTKLREAIIKAALDEQSARRFREDIEGIGALAFDLSEDFRRGTEELKESNKTLLQYEANLARGVDFAERETEFRQKQLEIETKINEKKRELGTIKDPRAQLALEKTIEELSRAGALELAHLRVNQLIKTRIQLQKEINDTLQTSLDQFDALLDKNERFTKGVSNEGVDVTSGKIQILTSAIENLQQKIRETERAQLQNPVFNQNLEDMRAKVEELTAALTEQSFIQDVQNQFRVIPDALRTALTEGVRGVLEGTQTISQLFRNMASNILLSISEIYANKAIAGLVEQLDQLAITVAKSDVLRSFLGGIGVKIPDKVDVNVGDALTNKKGAANPQALLNEAAFTFDQAVQHFARVVQGFKPGLGASNPFSTDAAADITSSADPIIEETFPSFEVFDEFTEVFDRGMQEATTAAVQNTDILTNTITTGLRTLGSISESEFGILFETIGTVISEGLKVLSSSSDSGGGGGSGIFGAIVQGIGAFFGGGAAKGGLIPGKPSREDDRLMPMASGEFVTNSDAVNYYGAAGREFLNAFNNMTMPKDFIANMESSAATSRVASMPTGMVRPVASAPVQQSQPNVTVQIIQNAPLLDPKKLGMQEKDVNQVFVNGLKKDTVIRKGLHTDLKNG